jgi:hypothetical protein
VDGEAPRRRTAHLTAARFVGASRSQSLAPSSKPEGLPQGSSDTVAAAPVATVIHQPARCRPARHPRRRLRALWAQADPTVSSLQITAVVAATAHRVAAHDPAVAAHPWLAQATRYCLAAIQTRDLPPAIEPAFAIQLLDAVHDTHRMPLRYWTASVRMVRQRPGTPPGGPGGGDDAAAGLRPHPDRPVRALVAPEIIDAELQRLLDQQHDDGGWTVDFASYSPRPPASGAAA